MPVLKKLLRAVNEKVLNNLGFELQRHRVTDSLYSGSYDCDRGDSLLGDISSILVKNDPLIIDVGAFRGDSIRVFRYTWPKAKVVAFEADPRSTSILHNHWDSVPGVEIIGSAVLDVSGTTNLYQFLSKNMSSVSDIAVDSVPKSPRVGCIAVPSVSLSDYCSVECVDHIDLLSVTSCGSELQVIRGGESLIKHGKIRLIIIEMDFRRTYQGSARPHEVISLMESLGYSCYGIYNQKGLGNELQSADSLWQRRDSALTPLVDLV